MGRKKKEDIIKEFVPSKYQLDIFNAIEHDVGNIVIEASAGSGKTSTLIKSLSLIPKDKKVLFCAFNSDIVKELKKRIKEQDNVDIRTVHSLGYLMIQRNLSNFHLEINENKYRSYVMSNIRELSNDKSIKMDKSNFIKYVDNICKMVNYCRYYLVETNKEAEILADMHNINLIDDEINIAYKVLSWGKESINEIDYTDMVWIPNVLYMKPIGLQYDFIFGDEAQDFSVAQRELILKCNKLGTRYIFCGDKNQCIYSFASASPDTFDTLKSLPNTKTFPLSISYRCAKNIVEFARKIVPSIEPNNDDRLGDIVYDSTLDEIKEGDMVLCRNNAPLIEIYSHFIKNGIKCYIRGKDIGLNLKKMVESTKQEKLNVDLSQNGVFVSLYDKLFTERDRLIRRMNLDKNAVMSMPVISNKLDMIKALEALSNDITTSDELINKIKQVFSDRKSKGIALSTIHKAKGLEANNVYVACKSLLPSKSATKEWEVEQERNLMYVAYTRAKNKLCFIDEKILPPTTNTINGSISQIEKNVEKVLNKKYGVVEIEENNRLKSSNTSNEHNTKYNNNVMLLGEKKSVTNDLFSSLKNKRRKLIKNA